MKRIARTSCAMLGLAILAPLSACSQGDPSPPAKEGDPAPGQGLTYEFDSLDIDAVASESRSWCTPPDFTPSGYSGLDQTTFADVLSDYTAGWMTPLHDSLLGVNEVDLYDSFFEVIVASYDTYCDWNDDDDLEGLPPSDGVLLDPDEKENVRQDVTEAILEAEVISEGEELNLIVRECDGCPEGLAAHPVYITARMTSDGVLAVELELGQGRTWVRTLYITPDAAVVQAPLDSASTWLASVMADTPDEDAIMPDVRGTLTAVIRKDNQGGTSATVGISNLDFDAQPGEAETVFARAPDQCLGMHMAISGASGEVSAAANVGTFALTIPGALNCDVDECGDKERTEDWTYELGGLSAAAFQPNASVAENLYFDIKAESSSRARVGDDEFARGGIGTRGEGGQIGVSVDKQSEGFVVSFSPPLTFGGAMTISSFSDRLRMHLPDWLQDEIFDISFGGSEKAQVFVPARPACSDYAEGEYPRTDRRSVEVREGTVKLERSSGDLVAPSGTCVGASLESESNIGLTSDWVELGYTCE